MTAHTASPVMNEPSITPMPWKNQTTPTTSSTIAIARRTQPPPPAPGHDTTPARDAMIAVSTRLHLGDVVVVGEHVGPIVPHGVEHVGRHLLGARRCRTGSCRS